jgi:DNA topoisomerase I
VPKNILPDTVNLEIALQLLELPRDLGPHPEGGKKVHAAIGRFGPYVSHDGHFKSIPRDESVFDITLERAVALLKEPKAFSARGALKVLGKHPQDGQPVALYSGRYGPYVKHGKTNATIPASADPAKITLEEALALLAAKTGKSAKPRKAAAPKPSSGKKAPAKSGPRKKPAVAKKPSGKSPAKKTPAKKTHGKGAKKSAR